MLVNLQVTERCLINASAYRPLSAFGTSEITKSLKLDVTCSCTAYCLSCNSVETLRFRVTVRIRLRLGLWLGTVSADSPIVTDTPMSLLDTAVTESYLA